MAAKKPVKMAAGSRETKKASGIIEGPSAADLRPTEEAKQELQRLLAWERNSEQRDWVVGRPFKW